MAAAVPEKAVNGNHGAHHNYGTAEAYRSGQPAEPSNPPSQSVEQNQAATTTTSSSTAGGEEEKPLPKEMIGWYFVEQYYNTMSKEPSKLYLYYTKKSQFVAGNEAEKVNVAVGQKSIADKIKELDIQDCKVRVTNVDSQESGKCILVQVIGEISNRAAPHRKFVQTFILAEQPTGYFVLNDIFRYIVDEEEENNVPNGVVEAPTAPAETADPVPATLTNSNDPEKQEEDAEKVDRKLDEEVLSKPSEPVPTVLETADAAEAKDSAPGKEVDEIPEESVKESTPEAPEQAAESAAVEDIVKPEKPRDPDPTPIASPAKPTKATPVEAPVASPPKPAAPKTWANLVASNGSTTSAPASNTKAVPPAIPAAPKPKTMNNAPKDASAPSSVGEDSPAKPQQNGGNGWQTAGPDNKQRQGRQHSQSVSSSQDNVLGYVKNVTDKVDASILKTTLASFGKLAYFDVSRQKNCAFVEFADSASYNACVAANPHNIGGEQVFVEERRPRPTAFGGYNGRGGMRGGRTGPNDRPGSQGRGGFPKDGERGGYGPRGRGGAMTPRGRGGQAQAA
ncbi:uncharacterized protein KY384_008184 [Bacidia gigantensis]|uniref:uncharacterized protein n=1 Tax=Bacidia gigantensis TaxID=2732470 RepID=UPI001D0435C7|nr:uncharacterized protein KY384_008184 [Bacidia gigantensis]KAG8526755.1 hypothetical protein KY384_008184 [Bacidia gigantensis]